MEIAAAIFSGFLLAALAPVLFRPTFRLAGWIFALLPIGLFIYFAGFLDALPPDGVSVHYPWAPSLGLDLSFHLDGLSLLFALLITGIGALILIYAGGYLAGHPQLGRLYAFLLLFMASMLGLVLADNILTLFVFWELTSLSSYFLIGFDHERPAARAAALQALLVTGGGGLALLAGLLLLGQIGSDLGLPTGKNLELSALTTVGEAIRNHRLYLPVLILLLGGAFTKSAQFPFHFWLPSAMEAPTPISAYLHSATMVKAGVYLLARMNPILGGTEVWLGTLTAFGAATMLIGALLAIQQTDLKRLLAYSTVSALGILVMLLGPGSKVAVAAAMTFLLGHALYKGALFLVAGAVDHETSTRDVTRLGGLATSMPLTAFAAGVAALSMAGLPPLFGFIAKELFYEATPHDSWHLLVGVSVAASMLLAAVAGIVGVRPFFGPANDLPKRPHEAPFSLWLGPTTLAILGLVLGLVPTLVDAPLLARAVEATLQTPTSTLKLALWHGWTPALMLSGVTLVGGVVVFLARDLLRAILSPLSGWGPAQVYELGLLGLNGLARLQTAILQSGYLRYYLLTILLAAGSVVAYTLYTHGLQVEPGNWRDVHFYEVGLILLIMLATLAAVGARSRLTAIAYLGGAGYGIALIFVLYGAPDLAMTQFLVETLTVILFVLVFYHLPPAVQLSNVPARLRDAVVAVLLGGLMTVLVLIAVQADFHPKISSYFSDNSVPEAHGRNVVNVILVDYRGLDTLGEITVLAVAGVGVYSLIKLRPLKASSPLRSDGAAEGGKKA